MKLFIEILQFGPYLTILAIQSFSWIGHDKERVESREFTTNKIHWDGFFIRNVKYH